MLKLRIWGCFKTGRFNVVGFCMGKKGKIVSALKHHAMNTQGALEVKPHVLLSSDRYCG
jgi:hypothetical protein